MKNSKKCLIKKQSIVKKVLGWVLGLGLLLLAFLGTYRNGYNSGYEKGELYVINDIQTQAGGPTFDTMNDFYNWANSVKKF